MDDVNESGVVAYIATTDSFARDQNAVALALSWMTPQERTRFDRFRRDEDRFMFALGRSMARRLVGEALQVSPADWQWREGPHGRPEIDHPTEWHFNVSHSAGLVVCAIGRTRELGVDLEDMQRRTPDRALVPRYCSPAEAADVDLQGEAWSDRFLRYWTLKESYLKARGLGISVPLSEISFRLDDATGARVSFDGSLAGTDDQWLFHIQPVAPHHLLAVAVASPEGVAPAITVLPYR